MDIKEFAERTLTDIELAEIIGENMKTIFGDYYFYALSDIIIKSTLKASVINEVLAILIILELDYTESVFEFLSFVAKKHKTNPEPKSIVLQIVSQLIDNFS